MKVMVAYQFQKTILQTVKHINSEIQLQVFKSWTKIIRDMILLMNRFKYIYLKIHFNNHIFVLFIWQYEDLRSVSWNTCVFLISTSAFSAGFKNFYPLYWCHCYLNSWTFMGYVFWKFRCFYVGPPKNTFATKVFKKKCKVKYLRWILLTW